MSARPDLCGGYRVSGIPTAIANAIEMAAIKEPRLRW
jgi:hypothetical protein